MKKAIFFIIVMLSCCSIVCQTDNQTSINETEYVFIATIDTKESSHKVLWDDYICILKRHKKKNNYIAHCLPSTEGKPEKVLDVSYTTCGTTRPDKILIGTAKNPELGKTEKMISPYCYIWAQEDQAYN